MCARGCGCGCGVSVCGGREGVGTLHGGAASVASEGGPGSARPDMRGRAVRGTGRRSSVLAPPCRGWQARQHPWVLQNACLPCPGPPWLQITEWVVICEYILNPTPACPVEASGWLQSWEGGRDAQL